MTFKVFLDTNVILDIFYGDRPFYEDAKALFHNLDENRFIAYYSESVLTTIAYVLRKSMKPDQINKVILGLNKIIKLVPCNVQNINRCLQKNPTDFEDGLLYELAMDLELDFFITSNIKDFKTIQNSALPVMHAKEFNKLFLAEK